MKILDLTSERYESYFCCLEDDWSEEIKEGRDQKAKWFEKYKSKGLKIKLAENDDGDPAGMIHYLPIEESFAQGKDLYMVNCIWVHGHKKGKGNQQKRGMGKALLQAVEEDARISGACGVAAWGLWLPIWMKAAWFRKQGYKKADRDGLRVLLWKPFTDKAEPPIWIRRKKLPAPIPGKVSVTAFVNGWCTAQNMVFERAKRACVEFGDAVEFNAIDTSNRDTLLEWGISDALYINRKSVNTGPPPSYESIRKKIEKQVVRL